MNVKMFSKVLLRSGSLGLANDYFKNGWDGSIKTYQWEGYDISYRPGTSDVGLIYSILLKQGRKSEYFPPPEFTLNSESVRTVLDIGANVGISSMFFAHIFRNAQIHAFEPFPPNLDVLRRNASQEKRVKYYPVALGCDNSVIRLYESDNPNNFGGPSLHVSGTSRSKCWTVPMKNAGKAIAEICEATIDVVKIDTEGAEWEILTSLDKEVLERIGLIMGELHGRKDFALLDFLQPTFGIGLKKNIKSRLFNFYAVNRQLI